MLFWLAAQLLVYPVIDAAGNYADAKENARFPSRTENAEGYFLSRAVMEWFASHYLGDPKHGEDWRVSPLRAKSLSRRRYFVSVRSRPPGPRSIFRSSRERGRPLFGRSCIGSQSHSVNSRIERLDSPQAVERWRVFWKGELAGL
jgi:acetyl esterase/lipase